MPVTETIEEVEGKERERESKRERKRRREEEEKMDYRLCLTGPW